LQADDLKAMTTTSQQLCEINLEVKHLGSQINKAKAFKPHSGSLLF